MKRIFPLILVAACSRHAVVDQPNQPAKREFQKPVFDLREEPSAGPLKPPVPEMPARAEEPQREPETLDEALDRMDAGIAETIRSRIDSGRKMEINEEEAFAISLYMIEPQSEQISALSQVLPKASIELVRSIHERNVLPDDANGIAEFLTRFLDEQNMRRPDKFDENLSHVIGRQWKEIDYSGEGMTWQKAKSIFEPMGIPDFKTAEHVERYYQWESKQAYFRRLYGPRGN